MRKLLMLNTGFKDYVGQGDPEEFDRGTSMVLYNAREIVNTNVPLPQPGGGLSMQKVTSVQSIGINRTGVTLKLKPVLMQELKGKAEETMYKMIEICEKDELEHRAQDAGLTLPSRGGQLPQPPKRT